MQVSSFFVTTRSLVNIPTCSYYFFLVVRTFIPLATFKYTVYSIMNYRHLAVQYIHFLLLFFDIVVAVVPLLSRVQLFETLWTAARQASLSFTISPSLLKLVSVEIYNWTLRLRVAGLRSKCCEPSIVKNTWLLGTFLTINS